MKFRYFLRGVGTGIVFATIIFIIAYNGNGASLSDKEIISRAKALGMVEKNDTVAALIEDSTSTEEKSNKNASKDNKKKEKDSKESSNTTENNKDNKVTSEEVASTEEIVTEETTEETIQEGDTDSEGEYITFTVEPGSSSFPVCQKLEKLGLIKDAAKFDDYLIEKGYANKISAGTHKLKKGMSEKEIAIAISDK